MDTFLQQDTANAGVETHSLDTLSCPGKIERRGTPKLSSFKNYLNTRVKQTWEEYTNLMTNSKTYELYKNLSEHTDINPFLQKKPKSKRLEYCLIASIRYLEWIREAELSLLNRTKLLEQDVTSGKGGFRRSFDALCTVGRLAEIVNTSPAATKVSLNISDVSKNIGPNLVKVLRVKDSISSFVNCLKKESRRLTEDSLSKVALRKLGKCKWGKHRCSLGGTKKSKKGNVRKDKKGKKRMRRRRRKSKTSKRKKTKGGSGKEKKKKTGRPRKGKKKKNGRNRNRKRNDDKN